MIPTVSMPTVVLAGDHEVLVRSAQVNVWLLQVVSSEVWWQGCSVDREACAEPTRYRVVVLTSLPAGFTGQEIEKVTSIRYIPHLTYRYP